MAFAWRSLVLLGFAWRRLASHCCLALFDLFRLDMLRRALFCSTLRCLANFAYLNCHVCSACIILHCLECKVHPMQTSVIAKRRKQSEQSEQIDHELYSLDVHMFLASCDRACLDWMDFALKAMQAEHSWHFKYAKCTRQRKVEQN